MGLYDYFSDPENQGMLALASGFLQAGGASPYPVGLGQAFGQALQGSVAQYNQAQKAKQERALEAQRAALLQEQVRQAQDQSRFNAEMSPMLNNPGGYSPEAIERVGMRAGVSGHPGAATLVTIAQRMREKQAADAQFQQFKSGEDKAGLFSALEDSPYVGKEARALQARLDADKTGNPREWATRYEHLQKAHLTALEADKRREDPLVPVMENGRAVYRRRSQAEGMTPANAPGAAGAGGTPGLTGEDYLKSLNNPGMAALVKKVANYEIDPKTFSTRGGQREQILAAVAQYDPSFDQKTYNAQYNAINRFATGPQGNTARSLNVAIEHMDTAKRLGLALQNGNVQAVNSLAQTIAEQTGKPAPTNFDAVKEIVADEVVKGVIGGAGALQDREAAAKKVRRASSPEQLVGVLDSWTELLGGQLKGLEKQYEGSTGRKDFRERYLTPRAQSALSPNKGSGGWNDEKEQRYQELLRKQRGS